MIVIICFLAGLIFGLLLGIVWSMKYDKDRCWYCGNPKVKPKTMKEIDKEVDKILK